MKNYDYIFLLDDSVGVNLYNTTILKQLNISEHIFSFVTISDLLVKLDELAANVHVLLITDLYLDPTSIDTENGLDFLKRIDQENRAVKFDFFLTTSHVSKEVLSEIKKFNFINPIKVFEKPLKPSYLN